MNSTQKSRKRTIIILFLFVVGMFGFGYVLVPIYKVVCQVTGLNGKVYASDKELQSHLQIDKSRSITVEFLTTMNEGLDWEFYPRSPRIKIHPGEATRVQFYAKNKTNHAMTVQAVPSITPGLATKYLRKTECFCFTQQTLAAGESLDMPVLFHLDNDIPQNIHEVTLSYTMFDTDQHLVKDNDKTGRV